MTRGEEPHDRMEDSPAAEPEVPLPNRVVGVRGEVHGRALTQAKTATLPVYRSSTAPTSINPPEPAHSDWWNSAVGRCDHTLCGKPHACKNARRPPRLPDS